jgi:hypothetical protein
VRSDLESETDPQVPLFQPRDPPTSAFQAAPHPQRTERIVTFCARIGFPPNLCISFAYQVLIRAGSSGGDAQPKA